MIDDLDKEQDRKNLQESINRFKPLYNKACKETQEYKKTYAEVLIRLGLFKSFDAPYLINLDKDNVDVIEPQTQMPVVFSYEKVLPNLYILWDSDHELRATVIELETYFKKTQGKSCFESLRLPIPFRPYIFTKALGKLDPGRDELKSEPVKNLALELTCDRGQEILDSCASGKIDVSKAGKMLMDDHMSTSLDNYELLLFIAVRDKIKMHAIDVPAHIYDNMYSTLGKTPEEISNNRDAKYIAPNLRKLSSGGKTLAIIGGAHRKSLLDLLKKDI